MLFFVTTLLVQGTLQSHRRWCLSSLFTEEDTFFNLRIGSEIIVITALFALQHLCGGADKNISLSTQIL